MGAGQDRPIREKQVGVVVEDPGDPSQRVLVEQAVESAEDLVERSEDVVEKVHPEAGVKRRQRSDLLAVPQGRRTACEGHEVGPDRTGRQWQNRGHPASGDDAKNQLPPVDRRPANRDMTVEDEHDIRLVTLPDDRLSCLETA
jgi:hypothetical protein